MWYLIKMKTRKYAPPIFKGLIYKPLNAILVVFNLLYEITDIMNERDFRNQDV